MDKGWILACPTCDSVWCGEWRLVIMGAIYKSMLFSLWTPPEEAPPKEIEAFKVNSFVGREFALPGYVGYDAVDTTTDLRNFYEA